MANVKVNKTKRQIIEEHIFVIHMTDKGFNIQHIKNFLHINKKRQTP